MKTIGWLLSRMILVRFVAILAGVTAFVVSLTLITYSEEILRNAEGTAGLARYAMLLAPVTASTFMAISVLLAILLALVELSYRSELTAIWATGLSPLRVVFMLLPMSLVIGGITFLIADQAVPRATPELIEWGIGKYGHKKALGQRGQIWLRAGNDVLRAKSANKAATELKDVIIFRRADDGQLLEQVHASSASLLDGNNRWQLSGVAIYHAGNQEPNRLDQLVYSGNIRPARAGKRSGEPEEMSTVDLSYFIRNAGFGIKPVHVFETWWHRRSALLFTPWLMVALCIPLAVKFRRGGAAGRLFMIGLAIGFTFSIFEGVALTMGEVGFVPPWFGAWAPFLVYAAIAAALGFRAETVK